MTREAGNIHENGLQNSESHHEHVTPSSSCHSAPATITVETSKGKNHATACNLQSVIGKYQPHSKNVDISKLCNWLDINAAQAAYPFCPSEFKLFT